MQIPKGKQLAYRKRSRKARIGVDRESDLQKFVEDYLDYKGLKYIRIPDSFFRFVNYRLPIAHKIWFNGMFGGFPDVLVLLPAGEYPLALCLELKSAKGRLHGKQIANAKRYNWKVARTPEEAMCAIDAAERAAEALQGAAEGVSRKPPRGGENT